MALEFFVDKNAAKVEGLFQLYKHSFFLLPAPKNNRTFVPSFKRPILTVEQAFFFDMDGTLFNSMPNHARAWEIVAARYGLRFPQLTCYRQEGRTGMDILHQLFREQDASEQTNCLNALTHEQREQLLWQIYEEKSRLFHEMGEPEPIAGVAELLLYLQQRGDTQLWIVTGSAQQSLFDRLAIAFSGIFARERMITALDIEHGKPAPDPYLAAWKRSGLNKEQCFVVENAPLGVRSAKAAGLCCYAVNTGPLPDDDLLREGADQVFSTMNDLLHFLKIKIL